MKIEAWLLVILTLFLIIGCDVGLVKSAQKVSINEHFGTLLESYTHEVTGGRVNCITGSCPVNVEVVKEEKQCYFCSSPILSEGRLELERERQMGGSKSFEFGCMKSYEGPVMEGFNIVTKESNVIVAEGEVKHYNTVKSIKCDKIKDPECDDMVYGNCAEEGQYVYIENVKMTFKP